MVDGVALDVSRRVMLRWYAKTPAAWRWDPDHFWWPAYHEAAKAAGRPVESPAHGRNLRARRARWGCLTELRQLTRRDPERAATFTDAAEASGVPVDAPDRRGPAAPARLAAAWAETRRFRGNWTPRTRLWVYLVAVEGWTREEVAACWGVSESAVHVAVRRAGTNTRTWGD